MEAVSIPCWTPTAEAPLPAELAERLPPEARRWIETVRENPPQAPLAHPFDTATGPLLLLALPYPSEPPLLIAALDLRTIFPETDTFFRTLVQSLRAVLWEADARTFRFTYVSPQAEELLGYPVHRWLEEPDFWAAHIHPEDRDRAIAYCRETTDRGKDHDFTYRMIRADGQVIWVRDIVTVVPDEQGRPHRLRGLLLDITEEQETRRELEVFRQRYQDLISNNPIATGVYCRDQVVYANPSMARLFGAERPEDLLGKTAADLIHPSNLEAALENVRKVVERREPVSYGRGRIQRLDGRSAIVDFRGVPITWEGEPAVLFFMWDVSKQLRTARRLAEREAQYQALFENAPAPMYVKLDRQFLLVNPAFARLTGYTAEELTAPGFDAMRLVAPQSIPVVQERLARRARGLPVPPRFEFWLRRKDGKEILVEGTAINIRWEGEPAVLGFFRDLSAQRETEAYLKQARKQAEEASQLKSRFLELMTHEIRTPLSTILGYADLLREELADKIPPELLEFVDVIRDSGRRLLGMLSDVLDLSLLETQRRRLEAEAVGLNELARRLEANFALMAREKGLQWETEVPVQPVPVVADEEALHRALANIVHNAVKFTENGTVRLRVGRSDREGWIQVIDTGPGMDPAFAHTGLFEPFRQESEGTARRHEGAGLGMAVASRFVEAMRGRIEVETAPGRGTTVTVYLPLLTAQSASTSSALHPEARELRRLQQRLRERHPRILIVEDNPENARFLELALQGVAVVTVAADAHRALEQIDAGLLQGQTFDVILLDLNLPGNFNGQALLHEIRRRSAYHHVPIVAQTAYAQPFRPEDFLAEGFDGFLIKPIDRLTLYRELDRLLTRQPTPS